MQTDDQPLFPEEEVSPSAIGLLIAGTIFALVFGGIYGFLVAYNNSMLFGGVILFFCAASTAIGVMSAAKRANYPKGAALNCISLLMGLLAYYVYWAVWLWVAGGFHHFPLNPLDVFFGMNAAVQQCQLALDARGDMVITGIGLVAVWGLEAFVFLGIIWWISILPWYMTFGGLFDYLESLFGTSR